MHAKHLSVTKRTQIQKVQSTIPIGLSRLTGYISQRILLCLLTFGSTSIAFFSSRGVKNNQTNDASSKCHQNTDRPRKVFRHFPFEQKLFVGIVLLLHIRIVLRMCFSFSFFSGFLRAEESLKSFYFT